MCFVAAAKSEGCIENKFCLPSATLWYLGWTGYNKDCEDRSACLDGGEAGGVSGFSAGEAPGGHTGRCLFGIGMGQIAEEFIGSSCKEWLGVGSGEVERCGGMGRGSAIVAMVTGVAGGRLTRLERRTR